MNTEVSFIGAGKMASAIVGGLLANQHYTPQEIACTCGNDPTGAQLAQETGILYLPNLTDLLKNTEVIVLACKPQQINDLSPELADLTAGKLILSILAGTSLSKLHEKFGQARNIVRAMPNTPGQIGAGVTGYSPQSELSTEDQKTINKILGSLGPAYALEESHLDAVTAISGSGPAYIFEFAAALREAANALKLPAEIAHHLAIQTVIGAAKLMEETQTDPETLRNNVTSPGGTTQAALEAFQKAGLREIVSEATVAARDRSVELSKL